MHLRAWLEGLPTDTKWEAITWSERDNSGVIIAVADDGSHVRFEPVGEEWYEEIRSSLERGTNTTPLLRAALPTPSNTEAVETARRCALSCSTQTSGVFCTGVRYLAAAGQTEVPRTILGAIAVGLALEHRYEYTHEAAITDVCRIEEVAHEALREHWQNVVRSIGTTNLRRVATTDAYHDTAVVPRPIEQN